MDFGLEIYDGAGVRVLGMDDFTYTKIFETTIPAPGADTSPYNVTVPGFKDSDCVVIFTPTDYAGEQPGHYLPQGFVPVYRSPGGEVVSVIRRPLAAYWAGFWVPYNLTSVACKMEVFRIFGGV